eukprot:jgi/Chrzof1/13415/Cz07g32060.t1
MQQTYTRMDASADWRSNPLVGPFVFTAYIVLMEAAGFGCSVRGLPVWYQLLIALAGIVAVTGLWLTNLTNPGILPPSSCKGSDSLLRSILLLGLHPRKSRHSSNLSRIN